MGKFNDFYVVPPNEAGRAARSMGNSKRWPSESVNWVDVFQVAILYDLLRGEPSEETWRLFAQRVEIDDDATNNTEDGEPGGLFILVSTFPADFTTRLATLNDAERHTLAAPWQAHPQFHWSRKAGVATEVLGELCRLTTLAVERQEVVILAESGD